MGYMCDWCHPDAVDLGFELRDERLRATVHGDRCWSVRVPTAAELREAGFDPAEHEDCEAGDFDCDEGEGCGTVTIRIERNYRTCEGCGQGTTYDCSFVVVGPGASATVPTEEAAHAVVAVLWPGAHESARERDDDGERWLRYAESGVMG